MGDWRIVVADCRAAMAEMAADSVDAVVCDPPYFLNFMNKGWDKANPKALDCDGLPGTRGHGRKPAENAAIARENCRASQAWHDTWAREALRVMKPGAHLVAFSGTRTSHRLVSAIEDAGFEIRDTLMFLHAQGFPKGKDFAKDDAASRAAGYRVPRPEFVGTPFEAGWNVALKPAFEPIVLARKPLVGSVAANVARFGTGGLNVDGCRVGTERRVNGGMSSLGVMHDDGWRRRPVCSAVAGRWPANLVLTHHPDCVPCGTRRVKGTNVPGAQPRTGRNRLYGAFDGTDETHQSYADADGTEETARYACVPECPVRLLDAQSGFSRTPKKVVGGQRATYDNYRMRPTGEQPCYGDAGGASRFFPAFAWAPGEVEEATRAFYCAKASPRERNAGLEGMPERPTTGDDKWAVKDRRSGTARQPTEWRQSPNANHHPTVKPVQLMKWLCRLVTPPSGTILDPFAGSGSTGMAALLEGFDFVGIEADASYAAIAERRIAHVARHGERWLEMAGKPKPIGDGGGCYDGGKGRRTVARGPEHDAPQNERSSAYACGCPVRRVDPRSMPRQTVPSDGTPDLADLPLFAALGND